MRIILEDFGLQIQRFEQPKKKHGAKHLSCSRAQHISFEWLGYSTNRPPQKSREILSP